MAVSPNECMGTVLKAGGEQDRGALDGELAADARAELEHPHEQDGEQGDAGGGLADVAAAAGERDAADDGGGDGVEVEAARELGVDVADVGGVDEARRRRRAAPRRCRRPEITRPVRMPDIEAARRLAPVA